MIRKIVCQQSAVTHFSWSFHPFAACLLAVVMAISGCNTRQQKSPEISEISAVFQPLPTAPDDSSEVQKREEVQETVASLPGSGLMVWARGLEGELIVGLDGQLYLPYSASTIMRVQSLMKNRGLYSGPLNGVLDAPTMESIYTFQEANYYMLRCGVPTPRTRKLLEQGSHTDVHA